MEAPFYEYIVIGLGGLGSGTLYWLSKQAGNKVLGLEQYRLGHDHGGSQDHSRAIHHGYTDKKYTKLIRHAYEAWAEVEKESGQKLVHITGGVYVAPNGTANIQGLKDSARAMDANDIVYQTWTGSELRQRFPQWAAPDDVTALYEPQGGIVDAALANSVHIQLARAHGATVKENCTVIKLQPTENDQCVVHTSHGEFRCRRVVVTCGAWVNTLLSSVGVNIPVVVTQEQVSYYATPNVKDFTKQNIIQVSRVDPELKMIFPFRTQILRQDIVPVDMVRNPGVYFNPNFPICSFHDGSGFLFYAMPSHVNSGFKIGIDPGGPAVSPETRNYNPDPIREKLCEAFMRKYIPKSLGPLMYTKTCLYTMTLDRNFVVDNLESRGMSQIVVCVGAGHAYKFASFLGKVLAELALYDMTQYDVSEFSMDWEAVRNPHYKPDFWRGDLSQAKL